MKIILYFVLIYFWFLLGILLFILKIKDVIFEDGDSIIFNCIYFKINIEYIVYRIIKW